MTMSVSDNKTQDLLKTICDKLDILIKMNKPITIKADLTDEDKLFCPFCQQKLWQDKDGFYTCYTDNCGCMAFGGNGASGSKSLWLALIETKKKLDVCIRGLDQMTWGCNSVDAEELLKQIKQKENQ